MKFKSAILSVLMLMLMVGTAAADSITYSDLYANWPGHFVFNADEFGTPKISSLTVNTTTNGYLDSIVVNMTGRRIWDALFINIDAPGNNYEAWDYYVRDDQIDSTGAAMFSVTNFNPNTDYILATEGRVGHPIGIEPNVLTPFNGLASLVWTVTNYNGSGSMDNEGFLTYTFQPNSVLVGNDRSYVIGYTPYCANDVFLTPVPEPSVLMLLGSGLLGLAVVTRKKWFK
jgi:hypothetical protein